MSNIKLYLIVGQLYLPNIDINAKWSQNGKTVAGGNGPGSAINQLHYPWDLYVDDDQTIYVAEYSNQRIMEWNCGAMSGQVVAGGNKQGNRTNQLNGPANVIIDKENDSVIICDQGNRRVVRWPRRNGKSGETIISEIDCWGLTIDSNGYLYVSDYKKHEVRRWCTGDTCGTVIAGGNGKGNRLDQLNCPAQIFVDQDYSLYVSDIGNHRLMKWIQGAKEGIVIAGDETEGNDLTQLSYPSGVAVDHLGAVYVVDSHKHLVMRWFKGATQGSIIIGGNGQGAEANQLNGPVGLSFDRQGNIYVADNLNHRIQKFHIDST
ncbi:unnamed protein product [Rotaria sp. Silwood2]|nr:unnamed protein product [Rotaria sp. Silwood2]CAF2968489.1 unnamed protein product [Rotaria sp. Silwood2]CAF3334894.1 unnamed protein product [Rotaria sp. Silwood2]CAF3999387.1 unnamed protein product [Rotaria sp. Silwood2]CAF4115695.1 unnamed protein product [Rotaria sp. Silwood2]